MKSLSWTCCAVLAAALALACGDDGGGGNDPDAAQADPPDAAPPDAMPALTIDDLCNAEDGGFVQFFDRFVECNPEIAFFLGGVVDASTFSGACYAQFGDYVADGTMELGDHETWQACLTYLGEVSCLDLHLDGPNPCQGVIVGTIADGGDCEDSDQCAGDAWCDDTGGDTCGVCAARLDDGTDCELDDQCKSGLCYAGTGQCRAFGVTGDACTDDEDCKGRRTCDPDTDQCVEPTAWAAGDECTDIETDCALLAGDLYCNEQAGECQTWLSLGDDCADGQGLCSIFEYEYCNAGFTDKCSAPVEVDDGEECSFFTGRKCKSGSTCTDPFEGGTCVKPLAEGDTCEPLDSECGPLLECTADSECRYEDDDYTGMCPMPGS